MVGLCERTSPNVKPKVRIRIFELQSEVEMRAARADQWRGTRLFRLSLTFLHATFQCAARPARTTRDDNRSRRQPASVALSGGVRSRPGSPLPLTWPLSAPWVPAHSSCAVSGRGTRIRISVTSARLEQTLGAILGVIGISRIALWEKMCLYDYGTYWTLVALTVVWLSRPSSPSAR